MEIDKIDGIDEDKQLDEINQAAQREIKEQNTKPLIHIKKMFGKGYKQGDILIDSAGDKRKILGVCGEVYFLSDDNEFDLSDFGGYYTEQDFKDCGYELYTPKKTKKTIKIKDKKYYLKDVVNKIKKLKEVED